MPHLSIVTDGQNSASRTVELGNEGIIGREKSNNIYIDDPRASRQHAKITRESDGSYLLVDMGSRNGIIVNNEKVSRRKLTENDRIVIGRTTLTYSESAAAPGPAPAQNSPVVETMKMVSDDKTVTAEPAKLGSDALKKAIQAVAADQSADKVATNAKKTAPLSAGISKNTQATQSSAPEGQATDEEPSLGKRIIVFLAFLIFFMTILLFARELTKRWLSKAGTPHPAAGISSSGTNPDK
ncbi:MAG TPA: FHA domain-containing protein [Planctomycetota bacterium]|nr:FHA domain-containing protein [Planctomycetota bacterium]